MKWNYLMSKIFKKPTPEKPDPKEYTTTVGIGSVVPVQIEAYFFALNNYLDESAKVLDVGFGLGYGLNILSIKAREAYGVDVDKKTYEYCQQTLVGRNPRLVELNLYDGYHLNYPDNFFNIVTCVDVIEHVVDYSALIEEMVRVSKKGVFISTPNKLPENTNPDGTPKNYWHLREWSFDELAFILSRYQVEWNFINGCWDGPFTISKKVQNNTMALVPFIKK
ncbi:class I SAM-dependent methyltransferase [Methanosphaerula palustris]|uniref:Methyltransferase type 11 n=1 Tax=Methanosphaerula palustris (strain ATCC BAA-1556 / DSM 19958 / E1-9c) TaxID=521011 RepID=B8GDX2_METPE|nr:class I SAM-dependent methyltransferase [Methanosphaerula palustris]ACL17473.1 Methyltransferase type 11 [Methanosphaerula palustris E1-9c]